MQIDLTEFLKKCQWKNYKKSSEIFMFGWNYLSSVVYVTENCYKADI
jgi:hypothetical protein